MRVGLQGASYPAVFLGQINAKQSAVCAIRADDMLPIIGSVVHRGPMNETT